MIPFCRNVYKLEDFTKHMHTQSVGYSIQMNTNNINTVKHIK